VDGLGVVAKRVGTGAGAATSWLHTDHLGSIQAVTNGGGAPVFRRTYRPYGETLGQSGSPADSRRWIGQRNDPETGLTYLHARYFDPKLGTFLSPDPIGPAGGLNAYSYAFGDPVNMKDPYGRDPFDVDDPGGGGAGPGGSGGGGGWLWWIIVKLIDIFGGGDNGPPPCSLPQCGPGTITGHPLPVPAPTVPVHPVIELTPVFIGPSPPLFTPPGQVIHYPGPPDLGPEVTDWLVRATLVVGSVVPVAGECMDAGIILHPDSSPLDRAVAAGSLCANVFAGGVLPNFGAFRLATRGGLAPVRAGQIGERLAGAYEK